MGLEELPVGATVTFQSTFISVVPPACPFIRSVAAHRRASSVRPVFPGVHGGCLSGFSGSYGLEENAHSVPTPSAGPLLKSRKRSKVGGGKRTARGPGQEHESFLLVAETDPGSGWDLPRDSSGFAQQGASASDIEFNATPPPPSAPRPGTGRLSRGRRVQTGTGASRRSRRADPASGMPTPLAGPHLEPGRG